jgi:hypothetical protein
MSDEGLRSYWEIVVVDIRRSDRGRRAPLASLALAMDLSTYDVLVQNDPARDLVAVFVPECILSF